MSRSTSRIAPWTTPRFGAALLLAGALSGCHAPPAARPDATAVTPDAGAPFVIPRDASTPLTDAGPDAGPGDVARLEREARSAAALTARPDVNDWRRRVIYFVLLDRFGNGAPAYDDAHGDAACNDATNAHAYQGGDLVGLRERLDHVETLGADAVWITPLYRGVPTMAGENCGFPGYWADFADPYVLELDPRFGTPEELDALLEDLHARDMPLMLDMVVNHAGYGARLLGQHPDWFTDPSTCAALGNPEIYCSLAGLPDFDHRVPAVRDYLVELHRRWLARFDIDAIRMDTVKHVEPDYFRAWTDAMRAERPGLYMVGELLDEHSLDPFQRYLDAGFDGLFNFPLRRALIDTFARGESVDVAAGRMAETLDRFGPERVGAMVNLLDNHDVRRFVEEIPAGVDGIEARGRYELALTALLTLPGVPQIYYGNELGMYGGYDPDNRRFMPSWAFDAAGREGTHDGFLPSPAHVYDHTQRLLALRQRITALQTGTYTELWRQNGPANNNVWAYLREAPGSQVIVVHNNGLRETDGTVPLQVGAHLADGVVLTDRLGEAGVAPITVEGGLLRVRLPGRSSVVLVPNTTAQTALIQVEVTAEARGTEHLFVTGDAPALGGWDLDRARPLRPTRCDGSRCTFVGRLPLALGTTQAFKLVMIDDARGVRFERGDDRTVEVSEASRVEGAFRE